MINLLKSDVSKPGTVGEKKQKYWRGLVDLPATNGALKTTTA
jgi:hypothetical protein